MRRPPLRLAIVAVLVTLALGCGKKGPPLAPVQIVSTAITDLTARRLGSTVYLQFTVPQRNVIGDGPADVEQVEVYALTGEPFDPPGTPLDDEDLLEYATLVGSVEVQPPPEPAEEGDEPDNQPMPTDAAPDERPVQGALLTFTETLTPEAMEPVEIESRSRDDDDDDDAPVVVLPAFWPTTDAELTRYYVAVARNRKNQTSAASTRIRIPLDPPPPAPDSVVLHYSDANIVLTWREPDVAPKLIQEPPTAAVAVAPVTGPPPPLPLTATPITAQRTLYRYNLFDPKAIPNADGLVAPINPAPLTLATFSDPRVTFGIERCYVIHTVDTFGTISTESEPSDAICVTPVDTFRPVAPTRLVAVGSEGTISLLWESNAEPDVVGYVVMRGEAEAEELQPLTPTPIAESTYRDTTALPGVSYVYTVVAVDDATPPNMSLESNRVEETAR